MQITIVLSALLAVVAASPVAVPAETEAQACLPLGNICLGGNTCCSGFCDWPADRQYGMPECVKQYTNPPKN
ncbi:hypothetical protein LZ32DRAFT_661397 [Colletotrichum eremochloae]|nr:hypothetical protein LZ32DRAFT_611780 [Colletotrichum eremochloae]KAK2009229.1 hypothetical protein LZ32DRAFT_661397 [Colletotrichum eremochloae]